MKAYRGTALQFFTGLMLLCSGAAWADKVQPIRLVTLVSPDLPSYRQFSELVDIAFKKLKTPYTLTYNPAERAATSFKSGRFDGDVARAASFNKTYPEAIRVDPPLITADYIAVSKSDAIAPGSWDELAKYRIAYRRGFKSIETYTANVPQRVLTDSNESCVRMVKEDVVDVCVGVAAGFKNIIPLDKQFKVTHVGQSNVYIWLGPQHKELAEKLAGVLADMQKRGDLERIFRDFN